MTAITSSTTRGARRRWRLFAPILAGATGGDRVLAALGAGVGIAAVGLIGIALHGGGVASPWIAVPVAASSVLVFAVPSSPMAQPWPVIGGNALSALVGICVAQTLGGGALTGAWRSRSPSARCRSDGASIRPAPRRP